MRWVSASAEGSDLQEVLEALLPPLQAGLHSEPADLSFLFVGAGHAPGAVEISQRLRTALGDPHVLGCTAGGVIGGGREREEPKAVSVLAGRMPGAGIHAFHLLERDLPDPDLPPRAWHEAVGIAPADEPTFVVLPDPYSFSTDRLLAGLDYAWPGAVALGGLASGASQPGEQALFLDERVLKEGAVGVALMGNVEFVPAVAQGCSPIGKTATVSGCDGRLLTALDGRPALEVLRETFLEAGDRERILAGRVLLLGFEMDPFAGGNEGPWLVRPLIGVDRRTKGLVIGEPLRKGRRVRFHVRDRGASQEDLEKTLDTVDLGSGAAPEAALLFSCLGRGEHLYGEPDHDSRIFRTHFGDMPVAGFFCNGEIGPVGSQTHVHGFTSAFGLIRPKHSLG